MSNSRAIDGVFAIDKPTSRTSADVIRQLQKHFNPSQMFASWMNEEREKRAREAQTQKRYRKKNKRVDVKMGHGGTLDPLATGVLIIGVGRGTKTLQSFLQCTKGYETTVLFGAATDTYDITGKLVAKAESSHITREKVEQALEKFKGTIQQKPPIYSAKRIDGKRLYEYARQGLPLPKEIEEREVTVEQLEIVKWLEPGSHAFELPKEIAEKEDKDVAEQILKIKPIDEEPTKKEDGAAEPGEKRKRSNEPDELDPVEKRRRSNEELDKLIIDRRPHNKRKASDQRNLMSGGLGPEPEGEQSEAPTTESSTTLEAGTKAEQSPVSSQAVSETDATPLSTQDNKPSAASPPGVVLKMTVTSGFYVRSLCHDLGQALGSLGLMATLVRTRQGDFELEKNVLPFDDLEKGEEVWAPKVGSMLDEWQKSGRTPEKKE